jgi:hypothetical protein
MQVLKRGRTDLSGAEISCCGDWSHALEETPCTTLKCLVVNVRSDTKQSHEPIREFGRTL